MQASALKDQKWKLASSQPGCLQPESRVGAAHHRETDAPAFSNEQALSGKYWVRVPVGECGPEKASTTSPSNVLAPGTVDSVAHQPVSQSRRGFDNVGRY